MYWVSSFSVDGTFLQILQNCLAFCLERSWRRNLEKITLLLSNVTFGPSH